MIFLIEGFEFLILRSKATLGSGVYYEEHFVGILAQRYLLAFSVFAAKSKTVFILFTINSVIWRQSYLFLTRRRKRKAEIFRLFRVFPTKCRDKPTKEYSFSIGVSGYNANFAA